MKRYPGEQNTLQEQRDIQVIVFPMLRMRFSHFRLSANLNWSILVCSCQKRENTTSPSNKENYAIKWFLVIEVDFFLLCLTLLLNQHFEKRVVNYIATSQQDLDLSFSCFSTTSARIILRFRKFNHVKFCRVLLSLIFVLVEVSAFLSQFLLFSPEIKEVLPYCSIKSLHLNKIVFNM